MGHVTAVANDQSTQHSVLKDINVSFLSFLFEYFPVL